MDQEEPHLKVLFNQLHMQALHPYGRGTVTCHLTNHMFHLTSHMCHLTNHHDTCTRSPVVLNQSHMSFADQLNMSHDQSRVP